MSLERVELKGNYFSRNGQNFIPLGAHWVPAKAALQWFLDWNPADIEADFARMAELGFNTVRFDLFWGWFEPRPGDYNPEAFKQLDFLVSLAQRYQIYLHPTLFVGGEVGEAYWDVPWRHGRHPHADPEMLRLQTDHAAELARKYRTEKAILAWDLTDEPPFWIVVGATSDAMAINWTRLIAGAIRRYDPETLLCVGTSMEDVNHGPFRPDNLASEVDFFCAHPYSIYEPGLFPDPMLSERGTYCGALQATLSGGAGRPVMIHELGASCAQYSPERVAAFDRVTLFSSLGAGANGFLLWCYTDAAPETYHKAPYLRAPHETQFGLTRWDRSARPAGEMFQEFCRLIGKLDLNGLQPAPAEAAILVPYEWSKPAGDFSKLGLSGSGSAAVPYVSIQESGAVSGWEAESRPGHELNQWLMGSLLSSLILTRRAGFKADMPREYSDWQKHPLLMLPSPLTSTEHNLVHVHTKLWESVREYLDQGGAVYASLCADAAIPQMEEIFGARLLDHNPAAEVSLTICQDFYGLKAGESFHFSPALSGPAHWGATLELAGGQVVAVDQDGKPALIASSCGKGKTLVCAYPIESYLAAKPAAFERQENTHRLYQAFQKWVGVRSLFNTDQPSVEAATLIGNQRGYVVLTNHSDIPLQVNLSTVLPVRSLDRLSGTEPQPLASSGQSWEIQLEACSGTILAWYL